MCACACTDAKCIKHMAACSIHVFVYVCVCVCVCVCVQLALFLEDLPLFSQLTRTQLLELSRVLRFKQIPAGSLVYRQGSEGDDVYVIRRGYVRLLREVQVRYSTDAVHILYILYKCSTVWLQYATQCYCIQHTNASQSG